MRILILSLILLMPATDAVADELFAPLFRELTLPNGMVLDRTSDRDTVSCAATGLVSYAKVVAARRGEIDAETAFAEVRRGFQTTVATNPDRNRGWLYHFTDAAGEPKSYTEVSTIDTAIFYQSFLAAAKLMNDEPFRQTVLTHLRQIDVALVTDGQYFTHGFRWVDGERKIIRWRWEDSDEGVILYSLFDRKVTLTDGSICRCSRTSIRSVSRSSRPSRTPRDAVAYQAKTHRYIGVTASDGPRGYQAGDPNVFSPLAVYAASPFSELARQELTRLPHDKTTAAFSGQWVATDRIAIDYAATYILVAHIARQIAPPEQIAADRDDTTVR